MSTRPVKTVTYFHTFDEAALARIEDLTAEDKTLALAEAREPARQRMNDKTTRPNPATRRAQIATELDAEREKVKAGAVRIALQGLPRGEYRRILAAHPPRDGEPLDKQVGYNIDTFGDALIQECITATTDMGGQPVPNRWDAWADQMTDGQWEEVFSAALNLNRQGNTVFPH